MTVSEVRELHRVALPEPDISQILRYANVKTPDSAVLSLAYDCIRELETVLRADVCCSEYGIEYSGGEFELGFAKIRSHHLERALEGCNRVILFAATLGVGADRLISRYSGISPSRAMMLDCVCTERIEALCGCFEREVTEGLYSRPRYSPGYGDVPLSLQKEIFAALSPERRIGVTLNDTLIMSPAKSVTALIGIRR